MKTTFCQDFKFLASTLSQHPSNLLLLQRSISMAGLQYNFFPTDFFYPPRPVKVDTITSTTTTTQKTIALPLQIQKREATIADDLNRKHHPASLVLRHSKHGNKPNTPMNKSSTA
ncbi:hypothetical protein OIU76_021385 [Salix suchowensis]|nr:hypothetical protein OIU76_021385 [Salix suchowensis]